MQQLHAMAAQCCREIGRRCSTWPVSRSVLATLLAREGVSMFMRRSEFMSSTLLGV